MKVIVVIVFFAVVGFVSLKFSTIYRNKSDLVDRVTYYLDFVDENSIGQVKQDLVADAAKNGITLDIAAINIIYKDTGRTVGAQRFASKVATFENKQVAIHLRYTDLLLGFRLRQKITRSKIKLIKVRQKLRPEYEELLR